MEAVPAKGKEKHVAKHSLNLALLEEKVIHVIGVVQQLKEENLSLKAKNKDLHNQLKALEGSLVSETKHIEEMSQEKVMAKMVVDNLLHSIDELIEVKEK